jgi:putative endonuclease
LNKPDSENTGPGWFVYIIKASDGRLYTGVTTDVARRFGEHAGTQRGARFFRGRQPVEVVYSESHPDRSSALRREADIKRLSRGLKLDLIGRQTPEHTAT